MRRSVLAVVSFLLVVAAGSLHAQGVAPTAVADSIAATVPAPDSARTAAVAMTTQRDVTGATLTGLRAGVHARETARPNQQVRFARTTSKNQAQAMMIVGVAALIAGAIIGDTPGTIIMVGGTVVGLIGLYEYLQ
jgi:hypothetical protein